MSPGGGRRPPGKTAAVPGYWAATASGTTADLTDQAAPASADPGVATINAAGLADGVSVGTTTITATSGGHSDTAQLQVTRPLTQVTSRS